MPTSSDGVLATLAPRRPSAHLSCHRLRYAISYRINVAVSINSAPRNSLKMFADTFFAKKKCFQTLSTCTVFLGLYPARRRKEVCVRPWTRDAASENLFRRPATCRTVILGQGLDYLDLAVAQHYHGLRPKTASTVL